MKKLILAVGVILLTVSSLKAQMKLSKENPLRYSIGGEASLPVGKFNQAGYNFGVGGSLQAEYKRFSEVGLLFNAGFLTYSQKSGNGGRSFSIVPVIAGIKYYFVPGTYAQLAMGAAFRTTYGGGTNFIYSPGVGFNLTKKMDALIKFSGLTGNANFNSLGLRLAYNFGK